MVYKVITKIIANHLKPVLDSIVGDEQGAFVPNRDISDNIVLAHELVKHYGRKNISPRACIKVDLRKAFDSVSWDFLPDSMTYLGFPPLLIT